MKESTTIPVCIGEDTIDITIHRYTQDNGNVYYIATCMYKERSLTTVRQYSRDLALGELRVMLYYHGLPSEVEIFTLQQNKEN